VLLAQGATSTRCYKHKIFSTYKTEFWNRFKDFCRIWKFNG